MKSLDEIVRALLRQPQAGTLVELQGALLASAAGDGPARAMALEIAGHFYRYLCELQSKLSAREYSELASRLDVGAVGAVALENVVSPDAEGFWRRLLMGGLAEALMVAASRQYVKAWVAETDVVHRCATWCLADILWRVSAGAEPALAGERRWEAIQALLAPARSDDLSGSEKAILLVRIFQVLLVAALARLALEAAG